MKHVTVICLGLCLAGLTAEGAWPFKSKENPNEYVKSPEPAATDPVPVESPEPVTIAEAPAQAAARISHLTFVDDAREAQFIKLAVARKRIRQDLSVLVRLVDEKKNEIQQFEAELESGFGVSAAKNYEFDQDSGQVFELAGNPEAAGSTNELTRTAVSKIGDADEQKKFVRLVASKNLSHQQFRMLSVIEEEKKIRLKLVEDELAKDFDIDPLKVYEYEESTKTVYEVGAPAPAASE